MKELKPCPFCGGKAMRLVDVDEYDDDGRLLPDKAVNCTKCGVRTRWQHTMDEAVTLWNKRIGESAVTTQEALEWKIAQLREEHYALQKKIDALEREIVMRKMEENDNESHCRNSG